MKMNVQRRPTPVRAAAWIIIATSILLLFAGLVAEFPLAAALGLASLLSLLLSGLSLGVRIWVGFAILRGKAWARLVYLIGELIALNLGVVLLGTPFSPTGVKTGFVASCAVLLYLATLVLLTRKPALAYFGRPAEPQTTTRRLILTVLAFCVAYAAAGAVMYRVGLPAMSIVSNDYNPLSWLSNSVGEATHVSLLQSSSYLARQQMAAAIQRAKTRTEIADVVSSPLYASFEAVNENEVWITLLWAGNFCGLILISRRH
jgi:hypothetical protein